MVDSASGSNKPFGRFNWYYYDRIAKKNEVLRLLNSVKLPLLRAIKKMERLYGGYVRNKVRLYYIVEDIDKRIASIAIELPGKREVLIWDLYISSQETPLRPSQLKPKIKKLNEMGKKYVASVRRYKAIIAYKATSGAYKYASRHGIPIRNHKQLINDIIKYFRKRLEGIIRAFMDKHRRIYGHLIYAVYGMLLILYNYKEIDRIPDPLEVEKWAETGVDPPTILDFIQPTRL